MRKLKKPVSILLSLILVFSLFTIVPFEVGAETTSVIYIDRSWDEETKTVTETVKTLENPPVFEQDHYTGNVTVGNGWLFVDRNITIDQTMYIDNGYHVKLIIANGCTLTVKGGIYVRESAAFSVYGQQGDTGKLYATNEYDENEVAPIDGDTGSARFNVYGATIEAISDNRGTAGIGRITSSAYSDNNFTITIWGGKVTAEGGRFRAGISGRITIYGGTVNATGGTYGAGIGGGSERGGGNITINGGEVTAIGGAEGAGIGGGNYGNSGNITINSGKVNAYGGCVGAGIGGGNYGGGVNITINGGEIIAQSTDINTEGLAVGEGAGIGGGYHGHGGNITINGGTIEVLAKGDGAGIGGGEGGNGDNITINGGTVEALSYADGAGIGGGDGGNGGNITIRSGKITAISVEGGAGIGGGDSGSGGTINIYGGEINARCNGKDFGDGAGIGGGDGGDGGTVHIYGGKITAYADGESEGAAIGGGKGGSDGTLTIADGLWVHTGDKPDSTDWRYRQNRVSECRSSKYAYIEPCTRHTADPEPDDGYPVWSDYETDDDTTHSMHCVACNAVKDTHEHEFGDPVWTWGEEYATAKATFTCSDCGYSETVDATVTKDEAQQTATATAVFRDTTYMVEQSTENPVYPYIKRSWNAETKQVEQTTETVYDYTILTTDTQKTFWAGNGWYVVNSDVTLKNFVTLGDNVNLLLCDSATLTLNEELICDTNQDGVVYGINIFAQENGTGELIANGKKDYAGIGGCDETSGGVITIHGGKITATGGDNGAGIGGGYHGKGGTITIYGGNITATGGQYGAGIGGGDHGNGGKISIYGGNITATGGENSSLSSAGGGAGIGSGRYSGSGDLTIYGGNITATGGGDSGAGIGGAAINSLTINDGVINALGDMGAAIGSSYPYDMDKTILITGGTVTASSRWGSGIGSSHHSNMTGTITVSGGTVTASSQEGSGIGAGRAYKIEAGIGNENPYADNGGKCPGTISITGGTVKAHSEQTEAIGHGLYGTVSATINIPDGYMVQSGNEESSIIWQYRQDRVDACRNRYAYIAPCTKHIEEPQGEYTMWSDYEIVDETNHTQHCVACNAAKELLNHDFSDPVWTWGENYSTATAKFTCPTCHFETTLDATVTKEGTQDGMVKATATVKCLDTTYTDVQTTDIPVLRYVRRSWDEENKQVKETPESLLDYTVLTSTNETYWAADGWYVVNSDVTLKNFVSLGMNVNLLLCDDAKLTCNEELICDTSQDGVHGINIFAQENGTGELIANGKTNYAGIGGCDDTSGGVITIHGGKITAKGGADGAGIGGGYKGNGGNVIIYGGTIIATGGSDGAGIGGGDYGNGGNITIYGGKVTAISHEGGAGIGGGADANNETVNIYGGEIDAHCLGEDYGDGAGIGGGDGGDGGTVNIYGGTVTAYAEGSSEGAAIGRGKGGSDGTLTIADGWMVRSGDNADSTDWRWREDRVSRCQSHHYAQISPCTIHENETYEGEVVWDKHFKPDDDATHSHTCLACNGDANIQNHNIAVSWTWAPDCSEATAHFSCEPCGFAKDVTASGDQITDVIIDQEKDEHKFTATVTLAGTEYTSQRGGRPIEYTDLNGETQLAYATSITPGTTRISNGWYALTENISTGDRFIIDGVVNLILCDGVQFDAKSGVGVDNGNNLTIWGQSKNTGVLKATGKIDYVGSDLHSAGIGANNYSSASGNITINGGTINATGAESCAGIGSGFRGSGTVTINGGIVTAKGGLYGSGIGSGQTRSYYHDYNTIGTVTITGGIVNATSGGWAAAIGGGRQSKGVVTITGGEITANSGGIGSGWEEYMSSHEFYAERGSVTLDYGENGVSVYSYEYHNTDIALSKPFTDGTNIYQAGAVTEDQIHKKTITAYDGMGSRLAGHSVSLEGDIAVNFYMELSNDIAASQTAYMQFSVPNTSKEYQNQTVKVSEAEQKDGYYVFKCRVAAKDMNSKITAQLIDGDSKGIKYSYSVKEYADYLIAHQNESEEFAKAGPLVTAMLNYGKNAEYYFDKTGDKPDDIDIDIPEYTSTVHALPEGVTFEGATLSLKSQTTLSLYFNSDTMPTLTADTGVTYETDKTSENEYVIRIRNISASELNDYFTVTVAAGEERGTVTYSPMTYCYKAQTSSNAKLANVVKALYQYWVEAVQYFTQNQGGN